LLNGVTRQINIARLEPITMARKRIFSAVLFIADEAGDNSLSGRC